MEKIGHVMILKRTNFHFFVEFWYRLFMSKAKRQWLALVLAVFFLLYYYNIITCMPMIKGQTDDKVTTGFQHSMTSNKASNLPFAVFNDLSKLWTAPIAWSSKNNHTKVQLWPLTSFWIPLAFLKFNSKSKSMFQNTTLQIFFNCNVSVFLDQFNPCALLKSLFYM